MRAMEEEQSKQENQNQLISLYFILSKEETK